MKSSVTRDRVNSCGLHLEQMFEMHLVPDQRSGAEEIVDDHRDQFAFASSSGLLTLVWGLTAV